MSTRSEAWSDFYRLESEHLEFLNENFYVAWEETNCPFLYQEKIVGERKLKAPPKFVRRIYVGSSNLIAEAKIQSAEIVAAYENAVRITNKRKNEEKNLDIEVKYPSRFAQYYDDIDRISIVIGNAFRSRPLITDQLELRSWFFDDDGYSECGFTKNDSLNVINDMKNSLESVGISVDICTSDAYLSITVTKVQLLEYARKHAPTGYEDAYASCEKLQIRDMQGKRYRGKMFFSDCRELETAVGLIVTNECPSIQTPTPRKTRSDSGLHIIELPVDLNFQISVGIPSKRKV